MANVIGPSFPDELRAGGVTDFRFSWSRESGVIDYHPDFPDSERKKVEDVLAAHDGPLSEARHQALEATRAEAAKRIAENFLKPPDTFDLIYKEINALAKAVQILDKKIEGSALPEERFTLETLAGIYGRVEAIRQVEDSAKAALLGAKSVEEVQGVKVGWPKE
jgi:hypothetical protein